VIDLVADRYIDVMAVCLDNHVLFILISLQNYLLCLINIRFYITLLYKIIIYKIKNN